jgi:hypothetical protein
MGAIYVLSGPVITARKLLNRKKKSVEEQESII